jgi:hypothetical protein
MVKLNAHPNRAARSDPSPGTPTARSQPRGRYTRRLVSASVREIVNRSKRIVKGLSCGRRKLEIG